MTSLADVQYVTDADGTGCFVIGAARSRRAEAHR